MAKSVFSDSKCKYEAYDKTEVDSKIVDSESLSDNTAQTYSGRIIDEKFDSLPRFAVARGEASTSSDDTGEAVADLEYPEGFNYQNCYFLQVGFGDNANDIINIYERGASKYYIKSYLLTSDSIRIFVGFNVPHPSSFDVVAVLMKYTN